MWILVLHIVYNATIYGIYRFLKKSGERPAFTHEEVRVITETDRFLIYERVKWRERKSLLRILSLTLALLPLSLFLIHQTPSMILEESLSCPPPLPPIIQYQTIYAPRERESIAENGNLSRCLSQKSGEFCYSKRLCNQTMRDAYKYRDGGEFVYHHRGGEERLNDYFIDQYGQYHQSLFMMSRGEEDEIVMRREIVAESFFISHLDEIEKREGEKCICPTFLGVYDNISFIHYKGREWIMMNEPSLGRVPSDAKLIKTRIYFSKNSLFHEFVSPLDRTRLFEHYDKFEVTFSSLSYRMSGEEMNHLVELNRGKGETFIFYKIPGQYTRRITLLLEGDSAICFTFCQHHRLLRQ